jgi:hypothetical protein
LTTTALPQVSAWHAGCVQENVNVGLGVACSMQL